MFMSNKEIRSGLSFFFWMHMKKDWEVLLFFSSLYIKSEHVLSVYSSVFPIEKAKYKVYIKAYVNVQLLYFCNFHPSML